MRSEWSLKNERLGVFLGVVQAVLKNADFVKEVKWNLRAAGRVVDLAEGGQVG